MIPLEGPFSERDFDRRVFDIWLRLERGYGEVTRATDDRFRRDERGLRFDVAVPGYGLPIEGTMVFIEAYRRARLGWELVAMDTTTTESRAPQAGRPTTGTMA